MHARHFMATYRARLQQETYMDKAAYISLPLCYRVPWDALYLDMAFC